MVLNLSVYVIWIVFAQRRLGLSLNCRKFDKWSAETLFYNFYQNKFILSISLLAIKKLWRTGTLDGIYQLDHPQTKHTNKKYKQLYMHLGLFRFQVAAQRWQDFISFFFTTWLHSIPHTHAGAKYTGRWKICNYLPAVTARDKALLNFSMYGWNTCGIGYLTAQVSHKCLV